MPPIEITSTTDTPEAVRAALGLPAAGAKEAEGTQSSAPGDKTPGQNDASASETESKDEKEVSETESEGEAAEAAEHEETETEETEKDKPAGPKKKGGIQKRVDKLNQRITAAQAEAEYWRREALKNATAPKDAPKPDPAKSDPAPEGKPKADDFNTHEAYVEALTDWKVDQAEKKRSEREHKSRMETEAERVNREHAERIQSFRSKHDDFDEILQEGLGDVPGSPALEQVIKSSDHGPELLYELAKDPGEAARIARLAPLALAREIGKLEARIASKASAGKTTEPKKITNAPAPLSPVNARGGKTEKSPEEMSYQEFKKWREGQLKTRRS